MNRFKHLVLFLMLVILSSQSFGAIRRADRPVKGEYIVTFRSDVARNDVEPIADALASGHGGRILVTLTNGIKGFGVTLTDREADRLSRHPLVESVEENGEAGLSYTTITLPPDDSLWALDRIDQWGAIGPTKLYAYTATGNGVRAYVVDYGIQASHREFRNGNPSLTCTNDGGAAGNRVEIGANFLSNSTLPPQQQDWHLANNPCGGWTPTQDGNANHGTAVASILGGRYSGVAKGVTLVPVKVGACGGSFTNLAVAWGLDWIIADMAAHQGQRGVVNLSFWISNVMCGGTPCMSAVESNIQNVIAAGIPVVVSANNQHVDACGTGNGSSPARLGYGNRTTGTGALSGTLSTTQGTDVVTGSGTLFLTQLSVGDQFTISGVAGTSTVLRIDSNTSLGVATAPTVTVSGRTGTIVSIWRTASRRTITVGGTMYSSVNGINADGGWDCSDGKCPILAGNPGSNFGRCVDVFAPAWHVQVAAGTAECGYRTGEYRTGTSYAAPIVAGVIARLLEQYPAMTVEQLWQHLSTNATTALTDLETGPNHDNRKLIYASPFE